MTPTEPSPSEVQQPTDSGVVAASGQPKQPKRRQRAARKRRKAAGEPPPDTKSAMLAFAYAEFQRHREQGRSPDIDQFCEHFPECRSSLRRMLDLEKFAASHLETASPPDTPSDPKLRLPNSNDESITWPFEGDQREDFTIVRELARGTFARVFLATEASTGGRMVVLKCSLHGDAEARTLGRLAHPHIVPILSARIDQQSGLTMVCMPYLGSATLEDVLDHHLAVDASSLPPKASFILDVIRSRAQPEDLPATIDPCLRRGSYTEGVIHLTVQLAETLAFLHQNGVCHRDLKPSNVLLDPSGKPLLLDFNLSGSEREAVALVGGTLRYMAPEQIRSYLSEGKDGMDERVDFYSLGVMVYELLGGVHPCESLLAEPIRRSQAESMLIELKAGFQPFSELCPELASPVAAILDRCVALEASERPKSAGELAAALKRQFTPARRLGRWIAVHRRRLLAALGVLLVAAAVLASIWAVTPPYSEREYDLGRTAYLAGDFDTAEAHFDRAEQADPNNPRFRYARGCARLQQSKYWPTDQEQLEQMLERIWKDLRSMERGAAPPTLALKAYIEVRKQNYDDAIKMYKNPDLSDYRPVMVLNNRAYAYIARGKWEEAQIDLDSAVKLAPFCQAVRYNRALVALSMHEGPEKKAIPAEALEDIEQALHLGPKTSALYRDAAFLYACANSDRPHRPHFERALSHLRQAIAAGEPREKLPRILRKALQRPEFAPLSPPPQAAPQPDPRLLDPVDPRFSIRWFSPISSVEPRP
jgi:tetratricopeptide (TPR) repeat protein